MPSPTPQTLHISPSMNYLKERNKELSIASLAQLEVMLMLRIGENNRNCRENLEDFNISTSYGVYIYPLVSSEEGEKNLKFTSHWRQNKKPDVWGEVRKWLHTSRMRVWGMQLHRHVCCSVLASSHEHRYFVFSVLVHLAHTCSLRCIFNKSLVPW